MIKVFVYGVQCETDEEIAQILELLDLDPALDIETLVRAFRYARETKSDWESVYFRKDGCVYSSFWKPPFCFQGLTDDEVEKIKDKQA